MNPESGGGESKGGRLEFEGEKGSPKELQELSGMIQASPADAEEQKKEEEIKAPAFHFLRALFADFRSSSTVNERLSVGLESELLRRGVHSTSESDEDMYRRKLLRFRPRLVGAVAAYATLANTSYQQVQENRGLGPFRIMWFLGSSQDDLIDEVPQSDMPADERERIRTLRRAIFGPERVFYQAAFTVLGKEVDAIEEPGFSTDAKRYLKKKIADWYGFLLLQESEALSRNLNELTFEYCRKYREDQNQTIGEVLTACLNGKRCLEPEYQKLEQLVPKLSFRTQIIDDIADLPEDLEATRPSYAVGALVDHPEELARMQSYLCDNKVGKVTPALFSRIAPQSYAAVIALQDSYGDQLQSAGAHGAFLRSVGDVLFNVFPVVRDLVYKISPAHANF